MEDTRTVEQDSGPGWHPEHTGSHAALGQMRLFSALCLGSRLIRKGKPGRLWGSPAWVNINRASAGCCGRKVSLAGIGKIPQVAGPSLHFQVGCSDPSGATDLCALGSAHRCHCSETQQHSPLLAALSGELAVKTAGFLLPGSTEGGNTGEAKRSWCACYQRQVRTGGSGWQDFLQPQAGLTQRSLEAELWCLCAA